MSPPRGRVVKKRYAAASVPLGDDEITAQETGSVRTSQRKKVINMI